MGYLQSSVLSSSAIDLVKLTTKNFACNQHLDVGSEEQGKDGSNHHNQEAYGSLLRTVPIGDPTSDDQTDNLAGTRTVRQSRLPCRRDLKFLGLRVPMAILFVEDWRSIEISE